MDTQYYIYMYIYILFINAKCHTNILNSLYWWFCHNRISTTQVVEFENSP